MPHLGQQGPTRDDLASILKSTFVTKLLTLRVIGLLLEYKGLIGFTFKTNEICGTSTATQAALTTLHEVKNATFVRNAAEQRSGNWRSERNSY